MEAAFMLKATHNGLEFVIEEDYPDVGVYLYVYENGKCVRDFLQNDIATCVDLALEDFGVPKNMWNRIDNSGSDT